MYYTVHVGHCSETTLLLQQKRKLEEIFLKKDASQQRKNRDAKRLTMTQRIKRKHRRVERLGQQKHRKIKAERVERTVRSRRAKKQMKLMTPAERREYKKQN